MAVSVPHDMHFAIFPIVQVFIQNMTCFTSVGRKLRKDKILQDTMLANEFTESISQRPVIGSTNTLTDSIRL
jgi:hypothetical protein